MHTGMKNWILFPILLWALVACVLVVRDSPPSTSLAWEPTLTANSSAQVVASISNDLPDVIQYIPQHDKNLAGRYSNSDGLSGEYLYLFSDGMYIFTHWADIQPETIYEKGTWVFKNGVITNTPDGSLPKDIFPKDHCFLPLSIRGKKNIFLIGANWDYSYLMENKKPNDYFMFKICTYEQKEQYDGKKDITIKNDLIKKNGDRFNY